MASPEQREREPARRAHEEEGVPEEVGPKERRKADAEMSLDAPTTYEVIRREGVKELERASGGLAWSGLAAGLAMGFSMAAEGLLRAHLPGEPWRPLVSKLGYSVGFVVVVLGSQHLYTENTLKAVVPALATRKARMFADMLRLWGVVLAANLVGALLFAVFAARFEVFQPHVRDAFTAIGHEAMEGSVAARFLKAVYAGWLIALMVWMLPAAKSAHLWVVILMTYLVGLAGLAHIVAGAVEVFYLAILGETSWGDALARYILPTLAGNTIGGTTIVAALNHAQVAAGKRGEG